MPVLSERNEDDLLLRYMKTLETGLLLQVNTLKNGSFRNRENL